MLLWFWIGVLASGLWACSDAEKSTDQEHSPLAKLGDARLYKKDLPDGLQQAQNPKAVLDYVRQWAGRKLLAAEALKHRACDDVRLERQVEEYRELLLAHHRLEQVGKRCSPPLKEQVAEYYTTHPDQFLLREGIYRIQFAVLDRNHALASQVLRLMSRQDPQSVEMLQKLCQDAAVHFSTDVGKWWRWGEITAHPPLDLLRPKIRQLKQGRVVQMSNQQHTGYFKLLEQKEAHSVAPLAFVKDQVKEMVAHRAKIKAVRQYQESLLARAQSERKLIIYDTSQ